MCLQWSQTCILLGRIISCLKLNITRRNLAALLLDQFLHLRHFQSNLIRRFSYYFIHVYLCFYLLRFSTKVQGLKCFLSILRDLIDATNNSNLGLARKCILQNSRKLWVTIVYVVVVLWVNLLALTKLVNDIWQCKKGFVDISTFAKTHTLSSCFWGSFWSS